MKRKKKSLVNNLKRDKKKLNKETMFIMIIITSLIISLSLFDLNMGIFGDIIKKIIFMLFGFGGYFLPFFIISIGIIMTFKKFDIKKNNFLISLITTFFVFLIVLDRVNQPNLKFLERISYSLTLSNLGKGGGILGGVLGFFFYKLFGTLGTYIILLMVTIANVFNVTNMELKELTYLLKSKLNKVVKTTKKKNIFNEKTNIQSINKTNKRKKDTKIQILNHSKKNTNKEPINLNNENKENNVLSEEGKFKKYKYPPLDLLLSPSSRKNNNEEKEVLANAKIIEDTMDNFNIDAKINQINRGPTITCYELEPAPGIKLNKIVSLSDNIALSLASSDIRIEAPIPGKAAVGIEVPNKVKDSVLFKELILSEPYIDLDSKIPLALGKSVSGESVVSSIDKMPHLLIAGATGSGKSVCINTIITSILYKSTPEDVKLILIDPKIVELSIYNGIPHLLIPVVTDAKKATFALKWAVDEMEKRYKLFVENNARDITSFNERVDEKDKLPMIVIIIDELADLMMVAAQEIEDYICRIAQKARAAGMYLIVATQRPSVDVITGTIKANIPSRISFAVSSNIDSRTILDTGGAEKLLGKGDMLFYPSFYSKPSRLQGAFISDKEVESVVEFLKKENTSNYDKDILEEIDNFKEISLDDTDELLSDAIDLVIEEGQASISMLQRRLKIGHTRAARIVDEMESKGIVGGHEGSKARKVLVSENNLNTN